MIYIEKPKLFGLVKTCCYCGKSYYKDESNGWGCCSDCYYNREVMVCRDCGREITKFDFDDNRGLCCSCYESSEITICLGCGREYIRTDLNDSMSCSKCNGLGGN